MYINAQELYTSRELHGLISGIELHDLFEDLVGEKSPSGSTSIDLVELVRYCKNSPYYGLFIVRILRDLVHRLRKEYHEKVKEYEWYNEWDRMSVYFYMERWNAKYGSYTPLHAYVVKELSDTEVYHTMYIQDMQITFDRSLL